MKLGRADAYYVLSDAQRRKEYDTLYTTRSDRTDNPNSTNNFYAQFANIFGAGAQSSDGGGTQPNADGVFADVFEEVISLLILSMNRFLALI